MTKQIVMCDLEADKRQMTTWLEAVPKLKEGVEITLKDYADPNLRWKVKKVYDGPAHYTNDFDFHRTWDNNNYDKHKGLSL